MASNFKPLPEGPWDLWAEPIAMTHVEPHCVVYQHAGEKWWVKMHGPSALVPVRLTADEAGDYYGWLDSEDDHVFPVMVWRGRDLFGMCFSAGPEATIASLATRGHLGKIVRMRVEERQDDSSAPVAA